MASIKVNTSDLKQLENQLKQACEIIYDASMLVEKQRSEILDYWKGNSGEAMKNALFEVRKNGLDTYSDVQDVINDLRTIAREFENNDASLKQRWC